MGTGRWTDDAWKKYASTSIRGKASVKDIYTATGMDKELDPINVLFRESCDSADNPDSTPLIIGLDVTGSMGFILERMARDGLKQLATEMYEKKPISDPHIMFMGVGDVYCDRAPLQVTQFEADIRIAEQLTKIYLERGGGGNDCESYTLPWWFAAMHTKCDNFIKRGKKGYLFTIGDECPPVALTAKQIQQVLGGAPPEFDEITTKKLFDLVSRQFEVFHIITEEGNFCSNNHDLVVHTWKQVLGERALLLSDYTKLSELIVSTLQIINGIDRSAVLSGWDGSTALVIDKAVQGLSKVKQPESGVIEFPR